MTSYAGLGFDPTPGEPGAVRDSLAALAAAGQQLGMVIGNLESALSLSDGWSGDAADDFHDNADDLPTALTKGAESMGKAADALVTWAEQLVGNKQQTEILDKLARELKKQIAAAEGAVAAAASGARMARGAQAGAARDAYDSAVADLASLREQLAAVIDEARTLEATHLGQAEATAAKIRGAKGDAFEPVGGFSQAVGVVSTVMGEISAWTGRAAFVAALIPGGQLAAGVLAASSAATGVAGAAGGIYAKSQDAPAFANRSYLSLGADGALSLGGPAGRGVSSFAKALKAGPRGALKDLRRSVATHASTAAVSKSGYAREMARKLVDDAPLGRAIKQYQDARGADSVTEAMRRIGQIRADDMAERTVLDKALEGVSHGTSGAVGAADRLDRATGGDGVPDWMKPVAKAPHLGSATAEGVALGQRKLLDGVD
ncbi:MAG TPA: hypothetical protein VGD67_06855 [Pseudonocardiaceae bacterium]